MYNYSKLCSKITEICGSQENFAQKMKLSARTMSLKLNNKVQFKQNEIIKAVEILGIKEDEICFYFFALVVQPLNI